MRQISFETVEGYSDIPSTGHNLLRSPIKNPKCISHYIPEALDVWCYICYNLAMNEETKTPRNIRIRPTVLHQARVAAVTQRKTLGQWLEEAIVEKIKREQKLSKEVEK